MQAASSQHARRNRDPVVIRPYVVSGGRTGEGNAALPVEALATASGDVHAPVEVPEHRTILDLLSDRYLSVMEISALSRLPLGVVRVLLSDLAETGRVRIGTVVPTDSSVTDDGRTPIHVSVLESVLNGINEL